MLCSRCSRRLLAWRAAVSEMRVDIRRLSASESDFGAKLSALTAFDSSLDADVEATAASIIEDVRRRGDVAVLEYTARFDRVHAESVSTLEIPRSALRQALAGLDRPARSALEQAATRIRAYHERQRAASWDFVEADGTRLGQKVTP